MNHSFIEGKPFLDHYSCASCFFLGRKKTGACFFSTTQPGNIERESIPRGRRCAANNACVCALRRCRIIRERVSLGHTSAFARTQEKNEKKRTLPFQRQLLCVVHFNEALANLWSRAILTFRPRFFLEDKITALSETRRRSSKRLSLFSLSRRLLAHVGVCGRFEEEKTDRRGVVGALLCSTSRATHAFVPLRVTRVPKAQGQEGVVVVRRRRCSSSERFLYSSLPLSLSLWLRDALEGREKRPTRYFCRLQPNNSIICFSLLTRISVVLNPIRTIYSVLEIHRPCASFELSIDLAPTMFQIYTVVGRCSRKAGNTKKGYSDVF